MTTTYFIAFTYGFSVENRNGMNSSYIIKTEKPFEDIHEIEKIIADKLREKYNEQMYRYGSSFYPVIGTITNVNKL